MNTPPPQLSLVIPCFNESGVLPLLRQRLSECLPRMKMTWEVIFVDDGSQDDTLQQLTAMHEADSRFKVLAFSRNFGHQTAVFAGLTQAYGEFVAVLDADLQDPPEFIATCVNKLSEGYDVVYAVRRNRKENLLKRLAYAGFYRLLKFIADVKIPLDSGDFCVMRQCVVSVLRSMPEHDVFVRGLRAWSGFRQIGLEYERDVRCAGVTKYPFPQTRQTGLGRSFCLLDVSAAPGKLHRLFKRGRLHDCQRLPVCLVAIGVPLVRPLPIRGSGLDFAGLPDFVPGWNPISDPWRAWRIYPADSCRCSTASALDCEEVPGI